MKYVLVKASECKTYPSIHSRIGERLIPAYLYSDINEAHRQMEANNLDFKNMNYCACICKVEMVEE